MVESLQECMNDCAQENGDPDKTISNHPLYLKSKITQEPQRPLRQQEIYTDRPTPPYNYLKEEEQQHSNNPSTWHQGNPDF
jgi:hypothetical protein